MANNDAAGAEAAVRYFVELADFVLATGELDEWVRATDDDCVFCQSISDSATELEVNGWVRRGGGLEIVAIEKPELSSVEGFYLVDADIAEQAHEYLDARGAVVESVSESSGGVTFGVQYANGTWTLMAAGSAQDEQS